MHDDLIEKPDDSGSLLLDILVHVDEEVAIQGPHHLLVLIALAPHLLLGLFDLAVTLDQLRGLDSRLLHFLDQALHVVLGLDDLLEPDFLHLVLVGLVGLLVEHAQGVQDGIELLQGLAGFELLDSEQDVGDGLGAGLGAPLAEYFGVLEGVAHGCVFGGGNI